jgi:hypothetical protein
MLLISLANVRICFQIREKKESFFVKMAVFFRINKVYALFVYVFPQYFVISHENIHQTQKVI